MKPKPPTGLHQWWIDHATLESEQTISKAAEYGTLDLVEIGRTLSNMTGQPTIDDTHAMELGVAFYALGKIQRIISSLTRGEPAKDDSWFDLAIYAKMVQAARAGAWPLNPNQPGDPHQ
jgi:hypothetical protein